MLIPCDTKSSHDCKNHPLRATFISLALRISRNRAHFKALGVQFVIFVNTLVKVNKLDIFVSNTLWSEGTILFEITTF